MNQLCIKYFLFQIDFNCLPFSECGDIQDLQTVVLTGYSILKMSSRWLSSINGNFLHAFSG